MTNMISLFQNYEEAEKQVETMRCAYTEMALKLQPLVIGMPQNTMVLYDGHRFLAESLVKGIDLCFKLIQVC